MCRTAWARPLARWGGFRELFTEMRRTVRVLVKRILNRWGYPPDLQEEAVKTVLMQAELLCGEWMEASA